jgi:hypothetical protein
LCKSPKINFFEKIPLQKRSFVFGAVKAGFTAVEKPQIYMTVLKKLPNGYEFANKCDIGGKTGSEWVIGGSAWKTKIYANTKLPRTGY